MNLLPPRLSPLGARVAVVLAALACTWMLVQFAWALLMPLEPAAVAGSSAPREAPAVRARTDLARLHLFGDGHENEIRTRQLLATRATTLNLVLRGTVTEGEDGSGYALIADASGRERSYRVGEQILSGVSLRSVHPDHVTLDHNGQGERLDLPRDRLDGAPTVRALPSLQDSAQGGPARTGSLPRPGVPGTGTPIFVAPPVAMGRTDWEQVRSQVEQNPQQVLERMQLMPVFDGTQLRGVRIGGGAGNPLLAGTGLRGDDVVTAVNGVQLDSIARGEQLFRELQGAREVQVTVLRGGRQEAITIDLSETR